MRARVPIAVTEFGGELYDCWRERDQAIHRTRSGRVAEHEMSRELVDQCIHKGRMQVLAPTCPAQRRNNFNLGELREIQWWPLVWITNSAYPCAPRLKVIALYQRAGVEEIARHPLRAFLSCV